MVHNTYYGHQIFVGHDRPRDLAQWLESGFDGSLGYRSVPRPQKDLGLGLAQEGIIM